MVCWRPVGGTTGAWVGFTGGGVAGRSTGGLILPSKRDPTIYPRLAFYSVEHRAFYHIHTMINRELGTLRSQKEDGAWLFLKITHW